MHIIEHCRPLKITCIYADLQSNKDIEFTSYATYKRNIVEKSLYGTDSVRQQCCLGIFNRYNERYVIKIRHFNTKSLHYPKKMLKHLIPNSDNSQFDAPFELLKTRK